MQLLEIAPLVNTLATMVNTLAIAGKKHVRSGTFLWL